MAIRIGLIAQGRLRKDDRMGPAIDEWLQSDLPISVGGCVRFTKRDWGLEVVNGSMGVVEAIGRSRQGSIVRSVRPESDIKAYEGRRIRVDTSHYASLSNPYASTVHKAQGQRKVEVRQLANLGMTDRQWSLVAFTRTKKSFQRYGADEDVDPRQLAERLGTNRWKVNPSEAKLQKTTVTPPRKRK